MSKKHLREIQERKETVQVENDLRGLGKYDVFKDVEHEPYVEVTNVPYKTLHSYASQLGLDIVEESGKHVLKVNQTIDFKKKYVHLLVTVASLAKTHEQAKFHLSEHHNLSKHIAKVEHTRVKKTNPKEDHLSTTSCLSCSPHATMTFKQIGLFTAHSGETLNLDRSEVSSVLQQENQVKLAMVVNGR